MARTDTQKRYRKRRLKTLNAGEVRKEELALLRAYKRKLGMTWLQAIYRGLGIRREDVLNSLRFKGSGNTQ